MSKSTNSLPKEELQGSHHRSYQIKEKQKEKNR